jgi:hypothetical protein
VSRLLFVNIDKHRLDRRLALPIAPFLRRSSGESANYSGRANLLVSRLLYIDIIQRWLVRRFALPGSPFIPSTLESDVLRKNPRDQNLDGDYDFSRDRLFFPRFHETIDLGDRDRVFRERWIAMLLDPAEMLESGVGLPLDLLIETDKTMSLGFFVVVGR